MLTFLAALALQPAPPPPPPPLVPPSSPEEIATHAAVRSATETYLEARRQQRFDAAWAMLSADRQSRQPRADWEAETLDFARQAGTFRGVRLTGVTLLENPGGVQGYFAAVEYSADYSNLAFMCGLVVWQRQAGGGWRLFRETNRGALLADIPNRTPETIAEGRRYAHCRD